MTDYTAQREERPSARTERWLWFGVIAGPVLWAMHLPLAYAIQTISCQWGFLQFGIFGLNALALVIAALTIVFVLVIIYASFVAYGYWRRFRDDTDGLNKPEYGRFRFMAYAGVGLGLLFASTTLLKLVPVIVLPICA
jgi:hypothetical protein